MLRFEPRLDFLPCPWRYLELVFLIRFLVVNLSSMFEVTCWMDGWMRRCRSLFLGSVPSPASETATCTPERKWRSAGFSLFGTPSRYFRFPKSLSAKTKLGFHFRLTTPYNPHSPTLGHRQYHSLRRKWPKGFVVSSQKSKHSLLSTNKNSAPSISPQTSCRNIFHNVYHP